MMSAPEKELRNLHALLADSMAQRLKEAQEGGKPLSASDWSSIARFLKDNGIEAQPADNSKAMGRLLGNLEDFDDHGNVIPPNYM